jgi:D-inositol-3-phosphate glycosyltransferase
MEAIGPAFYPARPIGLPAKVRPMRLLVITARYPTPDRPAAGAFVRDRLADPDLASVVVAPTRYDLPAWRRYLSIAWRALRAPGPFDGVEGHFVLPSGVIALAVARLRRLPLVVYAHGGDVRDLARRNPVLTWLARRVVRGADAVVTNSAASASLLHWLGAGAEVIPPGVDLDRFGPSPRPVERRVLYLGGDTPGKGAAVARRHADTLVGPGLREVPPQEIPALIAAHDVVLVPSAGEGFGLVAAEAIASGRWVVASAVGGLTEIVEEGVNGTLVRDGDFGGALATVPDYDPDAVAATASRFDVRAHRGRMAAAWQRVVSVRPRGYEVK